MTVPEPSPAENSDLKLVERTVAGDQRAYELLVIKYQRRIERLIGRMVRDTDLVQDIAQETFIRAYRALHQFRGDAQFYTWLYRIAVNSAKKALMEMKGNVVISENALRGNEQEDETSYPGHELTSDETPETVLAAQEVAQAVNAAVQDLPEDLRQAVVLREIEGLSYEEIAAAMGCPTGTVRSRIFRAREAGLARPEYPGPDRAGRAAHGRSNLLVAEPLDLAQHHGLAQILGQVLHGRVHGLRDLLGGQHGLRGFVAG